MKSTVNKRKVSIRDEFVACILDAAARIKKREDSDEKHAVFAHELQSALRLAVEFSIFFYFCQICYLCVTFLSFKH